MRKFIKRVSHKSGLPPGTLVHVGTKKVEKTEMTVIDYDLGSLFLRSEHRCTVLAIVLFAHRAMKNF